MLAQAAVDAQADHHRDAIRADYVLTENGGLHSGPSEAPWIGVNVAEKLLMLTDVGVLL